MFTNVQADHQDRNVQPLDNFLTQPHNGSLPSVSWVTPAQLNSQHPIASVYQGQAHVNSVINSVIKGPDWKSTAIFLTWDWSPFHEA